MTGTRDALDPRPRDGGSRRSPAVLLLAALMSLEALAMATVTVLLVVDLLTQSAGSLASAVALIALSALATAFLAGIVRGILRGRSWVRPAAVTWQVLQIAVGVGSLQGADARQDVGWGMIVPSVVVLVLLCTRSVLLATRRD